jgi:hypothetical protein
MLLAIDPEYPNARKRAADAHNVLGVKRASERKTTEARASFQRALALVPDHEHARGNLNNLPMEMLFAYLGQSQPGYAVSPQQAMGEAITRPKPHNMYRENAFLILGMPVTASTQELSVAARRLENRIWTQLQPGSLNNVREARRKAEDPNRRIVEEIYCYPGSAAKEADLQHWVDRFVPCPVTLNYDIDWQGWQASFWRLSLNPKADFVDPDPIRVTTLERGDHYEGSVAPAETPIGFAR